MGIPRQILLLCTVLAGVGTLTAWLGWAAVEPYIEGEEDWLQPDNHFAWTAVAVGILAILSIVPILVRLKIAGKLALIAYSFAAGALLPLIPDPFYWTFIEPLFDADANGLLSPLLTILLAPRTTWFYFAIALAVGYGLWLLIARNTEWFRAREPQPSTSSAMSHWSGPIIVFITAALVWMLMNNYGPFSITGLFAQFRYDFHSPVYSLDGILAFSAAMAVLVVRLNERADVDERGVRITLGPTGWKLFRLPWKRVRRVDLIRRVGRPSSAVIKSFPFTFALHAKRYVGGEDLVNYIGSEAEGRQKPVYEWSVIPTAPWLAVLLVAWGVLIIVYCQYAQTADWLEFSKTNYPPANFEAIASPVRYGLLSALAAACFGTALGVLSAFHHAGVRPMLLALFIVAMAYTLPGHIIHWLVWIAIFSIYMAMPGQDPESIVPHPTWQEWNWGMGLSDYAPVVGAVFYVLAVVLASRSLKAS